MSNIEKIGRKAAAAGITAQAHGHKALFAEHGLSLYPSPERKIDYG